MKLRFYVIAMALKLHSEIVRLLNIRMNMTISCGLHDNYSAAVSKCQGYIVV